MSKKIFMFLTLVLLTSFILVGLANAQLDTEEFSKEVAASEGSRVPSFAESLFGDEKMNIHIILNSGDELVVGIVTENGVIKSTSQTALDDAVLEVYIAEDVLEDISNSNNPLPKLKAALDNGDITYHVNGIFNKIKYGVIKSFITMFGVFSGEEDYEDYDMPENDETDDDADEEEFDGCVKIEVDDITGDVMTGLTHLDDGDYDTDYFGYVAVNPDFEYSAGYAGYDTCNGVNYINEYYCGEGSNTNFETILCEHGCISAEGTDYPAFAKCAEAGEVEEVPEGQCIQRYDSTGQPIDEQCEGETEDDITTEDEDTDEEEVNDEKEETTTTTTHIVEVTDDGFDPEEITIKLGDTVEWLDVREDKPEQAMIVGSRWCNYVRSDIFDSGESYSWTFEETGTCTIVDGLTTVYASKVIIEE